MSHVRVSRTIRRTSVHATAMLTVTRLIWAPYGGTELRQGQFARWADAAQPSAWRHGQH